MIQGNIIYDYNFTAKTLINIQYHLHLIYMVDGKQNVSSCNWFCFFSTKEKSNKWGMEGGSDEDVDFILIELKTWITEGCCTNV